MITLRTDRGDRLPLRPDRWHGEPSPFEHTLLTSVPPPVLDVGCGPGRLVGELARRGIPALGLEPIARAVGLARQRGATVLQRSVFDRVPGDGRWGAVLLVDGNVGIGGDPVRLLSRCGDLLAADGAIVAEIEAPGIPTCSYRARLEEGERHGPWFAWAVVGADGIDEVAESAGLRVESVAVARGERRWFARLVPVTGAVDVAVA